MTADASPLREGRAHTARRQDRAEAGRRLRAVGFVAVVLAGMLLAGGLVRTHDKGVAPAPATGTLPTVTLGSPRAVLWSCPGPLPAGTAPARSSVLVTNPAAVEATVELEVSAVAAGPEHTGAMLPGWSEQLSLPPHTERLVGLRTAGPQQDDAVSVLSTAGSVAVFESVAPVPPPSTATGGKGGNLSAVTPPPKVSPCTTALAKRSSFAAGSTAGRSDVLVSLFNPTATPAVASLLVSTGSAVTAPPAMQGVIVEPYSLQVLDLGRWVVQQSVVAVTATTSVGRVALGAFEVLASDPTASTSLSGQALLIGIASPQQTWTMTAGLGPDSGMVAVCVYDPGRQPANVTISSPLAGRPPIEMSVTVPAGEVRSIRLPLPTATSPTLPQGPALAAEGPITVRTAEGVGVVVARLALEQTGPHAEVETVMAATAAPAEAWVLPLASGSAAASGSGTASGPAASGSGTASGSAAASVLGSGLVVANPGRAPVEVRILQLTARGRPQLLPLTAQTVNSGTTWTLQLPLSAGASFAGIQVEAGSPVVVEQDGYVLGTAKQPLPLSPVPVAGIPLIG